MRNIWTIVKKEFARVFKDLKLVITMFILPGLAIFLLYTVIGNVASSSAPSSEETYVLARVNMPSEFENILSLPELDFKTKYIDISVDEIDEYKIKMEDEEVHYIISFEEDFTAKVLALEEPVLTTYYNANVSSSAYVAEIMNMAIESYNVALRQIVHGATPTFTTDNHIIFDEETTTADILATMLPIFIISLLFQAALTIGPESISGEKERGTISALLITPIKRSEIAIGKIISLTCIGVISAVSSMIGVIASMPTLLQGLNISIYGVSEYFAIFGIIITTMILVISIISIISAYAKTIKEATMLSTPFFLVSIFVSIIPAENYMYLIPIYNSVQSLNQIFSLEVNWIHFVITIVFNLLYSVVFGYILVWMFSSEEISLT